MAYIELPEGYAGVVALKHFRPEVADQTNDLLDVLLRGPNTLSQADRQLMAALTCYLNSCEYAHRIHGAVAAVDLGGNEELVDQVKKDFRSAPISPKLKSLMVIVEQVVEGGKAVTEESIAAARAEGATDTEIHDAVYIAAHFSKMARYIDGLRAPTPDDPDYYRQLAARLAGGYGKERARQLAEQTTEA